MSDLELSETTVDRFRQAKNHMDANQLSCPALTEDAFMATLLDTLNAVNDGYYTEGHTPNDDLRELVEQWRKNPEEVYFADNLNHAVEQCADELEELIDSE